MTPWFVVAVKCAGRASNAPLRAAKASTVRPTAGSYAGWPR